MRDIPVANLSPKQQMHHYTDTIILPSRSAANLTAEGKFKYGSNTNISTFSCKNVQHAFFTTLYKVCTELAGIGHIRFGSALHHFQYFFPAAA
jgi:hypothetical protein